MRVGTGNLEQRTTESNEYKVRVCDTKTEHNATKINKNTDIKKNRQNKKT